MSESNETSTNTIETRKKRFNWRGFFSLLLAGSFSLLALSGIILYITPKGRVAHWTGWTMLRLEKEEWSSVHITLALLVLIASGFHLYYNWSIFWRYIKRKAKTAFNLKREMCLALLLCVLTFFGTLYGIPPFGTIIQWNDDIKDYWEVRATAPPIPHAEELTIEKLALEVDMPLEELLSLLETAGLTVDDPSITVGDFAAKNKTTPSKLFAIIKPDWQGIRRGSGRGTGRGLGIGAGDGSGVGHGLGTGAGDGSGVGRGLGTGDGSGVGRGLGTGAGDGSGVGHGLGIGAGDGSGVGRGLGTGAGDGSGVGRGLGTGAGRGSGTGRGLGTGAGNEQQGGGMGYGRMSLQQYCEQINLPETDGVARLREAGIEATNNESLKVIAERANKTPVEIAQIVNGE